MKTLSVQNPANIAQNLTSENKRTDHSVTLESSFNQVLTRQANKIAAKEAPAAPRQQSPAPQPTSRQSAQGSTNSTQAAQAAQSAQGSAAKGKAPEAGNAKETAESAQGTDTTETTPAEAMSAEMLALVNSLLQNNAAPVDPRVAPEAAEAAALGIEAASVLRSGKGDAFAALAAKDVVTTDATGMAVERVADGALQLTAGLASQDTAETFETGLSATLELQRNAKAATDGSIEIATKGTDKDFSAALNRAGESRQAPATSEFFKPLDSDGSTKPTLPDLLVGRTLDAAPNPATANLTSLQQATHLVAEAAGQPLDKLSPRVGTPGWDQAVGQKVVWMIAGGQQSATLTLNPPDLGPLQVVLNVSNAQASASFTAAQPEVRQALENALPRLREMLADSGIQLGQTSVGSGSPNQFNAPGDQQQSARHFGTSTNAVADAPLVTARPIIQSGGTGLVDTFA